MSEQEFIDTLEKLGIEPPEDGAKKSRTVQRVQNKPRSSSPVI
jgi:hypothetical protein